jgi:CHASE2 domain-containing sensor protein
MLKKFIGESVFKLAGWKYHVEPNVLEDKQVIIGFEHTSMLDCLVTGDFSNLRYENPYSD